MSLTDKGKLRKFGLLVGSIFILIGSIPVVKGKDLNFYLIIIGAIMVLIAFVAPKILSLVYKVWMKISNILGRINSFLILSMIFYLILTPIGIVMRIFRINSRKFIYKWRKDSYWLKSARNSTRENMRKMF